MSKVTSDTTKKMTDKKFAAAKKRRIRKRIIWGVILAVVMASIIGVFFLVQNMGIPADTAEVEVGDVAITVFATGTLTSGESRDVYPETQGLVQSVLVADGDFVEKGDVLATLDDGANQAQLSQAEAALAQARSGLAQAESASTSAGSGTTAAQAALTAAQAGLDSAENMDRLSQRVLTEAKETVEFLEESGAAALDPAGFAQAEAALLQAEISAEQASSGVAQARAGVAQARAGLEQAQAASPGAAVTAAQAGIDAAVDGVRLAEIALEATVIRAPMSGTVLFAPTPAAQAAMGTGVMPTGGVELMEGSAVAPGTPLFTIINEGALSFMAEIDEVDIRNVEIGQSALVSLAAFSGEDFSAQVSRISNTAKPTLTGGTVFDVELTFDESISDARIGMRGDTTIEVETQVGALTIPIDAWFSEAGEDFVWLVDDEYLLTRTPVTIGASTEFVVEILDGLEAGDTVALAGGVIPFDDGLRITPVP